jgi:hypothetical protein
MSENTHSIDPAALMQWLQRVTEASSQSLSDDTPAGILAHQFFHHSWEGCRNGLLRQTNVLRVRPEFRAPPRVFHFEVDCPYKRKLADDAPVELMPGPVRGVIHYRPDLFATPRLPYIAVQLDPSLGYFHPNCSRSRGSLLCLGEIPATAFPFPLALLLETLVYPLVTYQNRRPTHPFDEAASRYFALDPDAMRGLESVQPLY